MLVSLRNVGRFVCNVVLRNSSPDTDTGPVVSRVSRRPPAATLPPRPFCMLRFLSAMLQHCHGPLPLVPIDVAAGT